VTYFLGTADNDPNAGALDIECEAMLQGDHRLERGEIFFNYLCQFFDCSNHQLVYAEGVDHDGHDMFNSDEGRELIFE